MKMISDARTRGTGIGLVLPGGGAKGAYQAGSALYVAEWLNKAGLSPDAIAGASVGALNGAVLAGGSNFLEGARRLNDLWRAVGRLPRAELALFRKLPGMDLGVLISLVAAAGASSPFERLLGQIADVSRGIARTRPHGWLIDGASSFLELGPAINANPSLRSMLQAATAVDALRRGIPLYVSVYPSRGAIHDALRFALSNLVDIDTAHSQLLHVQSLPVEQQQDALLASAAIPFIFDAKTVMGQSFSDGTLGGWRSQQGQVPAYELCKEKPINTLIVLHCSDGSTWDRRRTPLPTTIEIRPSVSIGSGDLIGDFLDTDIETIEERLDRGYRDAKVCLGRLALSDALQEVTVRAQDERNRAVDEMEDEPPQ
jgi:NTE family protein